MGVTNFVALHGVTPLLLPILSSLPLLVYLNSSFSIGTVIRRALAGKQIKDSRNMTHVPELYDDYGILMQNYRYIADC